MSIVFSIDTGNRMIKTDHFVFPAGLLTQDSIPLYGLDENTIEVSGIELGRKFEEGFYTKQESPSPQAVPAAGEPTISMTALLELLKNADPEVKAQLLSLIHIWYSYCLLLVLFSSPM